MAKLILSLTGEAITSGRLQPYTALDSLAGSSQSITMITHFAQTGKVRRRNFKDIAVPVYFVGSRDGSIEIIFEIGEFAGELIVSGLLFELIKRVYRRCTGEEHYEVIDEEKDTLPESVIESGDYEALVQAVEPSIRRGHTIINHGAKKINIYIDGDKGQSVSLDKDTKEYMYADVFNEELRVQRFMITSFDGRAKSGRAFNLEKEYAFTFDLQPRADSKSLRVIANAARAYTLRGQRLTNSIEIALGFDSIDSPDGRVKRLRVYVARSEVSEIEGLPSPD